MCATQVIQQGFHKVRLPAAKGAKITNLQQYKRGAFKVSTLYGWIVILSPDQMDEVAKVPADVLSSLDAVADVCSENNVYRYMLICDHNRCSKWTIVLDHKFTTILTTSQ